MPLFSRIRASTAAVVDEVAVARPSAPVLSTIGGYRPLRTLGTGACSTVFLAEDGDHCVALKVFTPECDTEAMAAEAACLSAVRSPHVVALLDTFAGLDSPTGLVLERVEGPTLDTMLRTRRRLEDGEFVTLAVSVLRGIHAVHSAGWCHGSFSSSRVRIDADGRPLLVGFSAAFTASAAGLRDERRKASELIALVSGLTDADATVSRAALVSALRGLTECVEADAPEAFEHLERELFSLAPPAPVRLSSARVPASEEIVETLRTHARPFEAPPVEETKTAFRGTRRTARHLAFTVLSVMETGIAGPVRERFQRIVHGRRRTVFLAAGSAVVLTVVALTMLPAETSATDAGTTVVHSPTPAPSPHSASTVPTRPEPRSSALASAADPVSAAAELLGRRRVCLLSGDAVCLADVDESGSAIEAADRATIAVGEHGAPAVKAEQLTLAERLGDAAVLAVAAMPGTTKPASLLVIRTEAGWRLRAWFDA